jgi:hypothetical protein
LLPTYNAVVISKELLNALEEDLNFKRMNGAVSEWSYAYDD